MHIASTMFTTHTHTHEGYTAGRIQHGVRCMELMSTTPTNQPTNQPKKLHPAPVAPGHGGVSETRHATNSTHEHARPAHVAQTCAKRHHK